MTMFNPALLELRRLAGQKKKPATQVDPLRQQMQGVQAYNAPRLAAATPAPSLMEQVRSQPDAMRPLEIRRQSMASQPVVDDKFSTNRNGTPVQAPVVAPNSTEEDPRIALRRAVQARIAAAQGGADQATVSGYRDAENFYRQQLALRNSARNLDAAAAITPEQRLANAESLDAQIGQARQAAAESMGEYANRRLALSQQYPSARTQQSAGDASRLFADSVANINAPAPNFAEQARNAPERDFAGEAASKRLQLMQMAKPTEIAALEERQFRTPEQVNAERLRMAQQEAQIRMAEAIEPGAPLAMEPAQEERARRVTAMMQEAQLSEAEAQAAVSIVESNAPLASLASGLIAGGVSMASGDTSENAVSDLRAFVDRVKALPPDQQRAITIAVARRLAEQGVSLDALRVQSKVPDTLLEFNLPGYAERRQGELDIARLDLYRMLKQGGMYPGVAMNQ